MADTSVSSVTVAASMVEHLLDINPHPQYALATSIAEFVKNNIDLKDLKDVTITNPSENMVLAFKSGIWKNIDINTLIGEIVVRDRADAWFDASTTSSEDVASWNTDFTELTIKNTRIGRFNILDNMNRVIYPAMIMPNYTPDLKSNVVVDFSNWIIEGTYKIIFSHQL